MIKRQAMPEQIAEQIRERAAVGREQDGRRFDQVAAELFPNYSRARLQHWIRSGALRLNGAVARPRDPVFCGATLSLQALLTEAVSWQGEDIALDIVHDDEHIIVLNKPAGLVVHPAAGHATGTLLNALLYRYPALSALPRGGIVHRLDRDTSGLLVVAKSLRAHTSLVEQLQQHSMQREYAALCCGAVSGAATVDAPLGRHPRARKKIAVLASGGKPARTHYRLEERFAHHSLLAVRLETGRTHQIRVHMAYVRHPLLGDPLYGGRPRPPGAAGAELIAALRNFPRQALHARTLGLIHPLTKSFCEWRVALPEDMQNLLCCLRRHDAGPD